MTQHSTRAASPLSSTSRRGRLPKRSWPARLVLVAALLLAVPFLFDSGSTVHAADNDVTGLTLTSLNPGELAITWDAPSRAPTDYRVTWKKSDGKWPSYKNDNTVDGGNAFPTVTSHTVSDLEEGAAYKVRVRARYYDGAGNLTESGPWSDPPAELTVSAQPPPKKGEGDSNQGRSTNPPAKPKGLLAAAMHNSVSLFWTDPDDDTITGYQILRGPDAANLAVLVNDTGNASASYTDDTVTAETAYAYAIKARNANGLSPQSYPAPANTPAAPVEPESELAVAGASFFLEGEELDTTGTCSESDITAITDDCTLDFDSTVLHVTTGGSLDTDDRIDIKIGRDLSEVNAASTSVDQDDLPGGLGRPPVTFQVGRNLMRVWGDEDEVSGGEETHFFRVNVVPYWEWNGERLSKDSDCRDTTANAPAVGDITDSDCIVKKLGDTAELRFFNVIKEQFNVYVEVNETNVINEPSTTDLGSSFTVNLDAGDNLIRIRLAAKGNQPLAEVYDSDSFYYKVAETDFLVSNLGQIGVVARLNAETQAATQFTTGSNPNGYTVSKLRLPISVTAASLTPVVAIYSDVSGSPGASLKTLANPAITVSTSTAPEAEFDADDYKLNASTPYWIVVENPHASERLRISLTDEDSEDAGFAPGWSIGNVSKLGGIGETLSDVSGPRVMQIAIKGELVPAVSSDATLSDLQLFDSTTATASVVTLVPAFDSEVTEYTATVANDKSDADLEVATTDDNATVEFLDENDATIPTAGTSPGNIHFIEPSLDVGDNIFKIKVTAEDTTTTKTYQVTITRSEPAVSSDATLSSLELTDSTFSPPSTVALNPAFDSLVTEYTAKLTNEQSNPNLLVTTTNNNATVEFLDENDATIATTDIQTPNIHYLDSNVDVGDTVIKIKVTAEDTTTTKTYQVTITRAAAAPDAPASLTASPGNAEATLTWTEPASDGGAAITKYQYRVSADGGSTWSPDWTDVPDSDSDSDQADERTVTVTSLSNGTEYTFQVRAVNSEGGGSEAQDTATPASGPSAPDAPESLTATRGDTEVGLRWTPPASDGGAAITKYQYRVSDDGGTTWNPDWTDVPDGSDSGSDQADERSVTVTNLTNETEHTFQVRAVNSEGNGAPAQATATPSAAGPGESITLASDLDSMIRNLHDVTFTLTRTGSTAQAADVTLALTNAPGSSVVNSGVRRQALTFGIGEDTVEFTVPTFWVLDNETGHFDATVEAGADYDVSGANIRVEVVFPTGALIEATLENTSYEVHEGESLTTNVVFTFVQDFAAPNRDDTLAVAVSAARTAASSRDYEPISANLLIPVNSWSLVADRYVARVPVTLETLDDALYERPMGVHEGLELELRRAPGAPNWVVMKGPLPGANPSAVAYPVTIIDDETLSIVATLSSPGLTTGSDLAIAEDAGNAVTLQVSSTDIASNGLPVTLPDDVKLKITPQPGSATRAADWTIDVDEIALDGVATITIVDDANVENTEQVTFEVGLEDDATFQSARATLRITDDDFTGPALVSAEIDGAELILEYDKTLDAGSTPSAFRFTVRVGGTRVSLASSNPVAIGGSAVTLKLASAVGPLDAVTVSYTAPSTNAIRDTNGVNALSFSNEPVTNNTANATGRPAITGQHQVGHTLTADTSGIDDPDGLSSPGYTYQWVRLDAGVFTDITGADSMVYTLTSEDEGKRVRVKVTFTDDAGNSHTLTSFTTGTVQAQTSIPSDKVKVSLDATAYVVEEGRTLRVTVTLAEAPEDERVIIPFTVTPANGASRSDFAAWSSYTRQLRFDVGDTTDRINVHANDDTLNDDGETLTLCLGDLPEPYATLAGLDCATINIMDNDDPNSVRVTFRSDTYWASEDGNPAWPRISVHPIPDRKITIPITYTRHGGLSEDDYEIVTTSVTFGPGLYGVHGDGHFTDGRTYASFPIEIWAIDDDEDDDGEYMDLAFGDLPPFVSAGGTGKFSYRPTTARVWFNDNEFTHVPVTDPPNPLGFSKRMRVSFADAELEAKEGQYSNGCVATVRVRLDRRRDMESTVIIPIVRNLHGGATDGVDFAAVPDHLIFLPGQTEHSFPVRPINDDIDDDGEYVTFGFGTLPDDLVYVRGEETTRVNLVDDDDPPVDVFFEQANYEVTNVIRDGKAEYARLNVKVKLSAAPERFIDVGIVAESIQGGGGIHFEYSAYIPRGPHDGAHFYADDTEFTLQIYISVRGGFDPNQTYRLSFKGMSYKMFVGSPATATITINADP